MAKITVDFDKTVGKIKPVHSVGQPPFLGVDFSMFKYLTDAKIPYSRLHDVGGAFGRNLFVDIPNIFRDFDADETLPESYDFTFTDLLITALIEAGIEPVFRLGVTIENYAKIKAYRIYPPKDYAKWARICEHIIRHYTEGWADGFNYKIEYWEIWNEPDNYENPMENQMWRGTKEEYYELYDVSSKHLKSCFPHLKIGGYASCGFYAISNGYNEEAKSNPRTEYFLEFFDGFIEYIKKSGAPLDFFSWHSYASIEETVGHARYARERLDEAGYTETETTCNEWNVEATNKGTYRHASLTAGMILAMQNTPLDSAMFYDARCGMGNYSGMFNPYTKLPHPAYYAFCAFGRLYELGNQASLECDDERLYAVAASGNSCSSVMISNPSCEDIEIEISTDKIPSRVLITTDGNCEKEIEMPKVLPRESFICIIYQ